MSYPCVLVVDDDPSIRRLLEVMFGATYDVLVAEDGQEALDILRSDDRIDAVVLDIMMPVVDGLEVLTAIRADERLEGLPVVMLTADMEDRTRDRAREIGCDTFLRKPFSPEVLVSTVDLLISSKEG